MQCPHCNQEIRAGAKFCPECGARLPVACKKCSTELPATAKFCFECGEPTSSDEGARRARAAPPTHLAERILATKSTLEGERKQVTVLFADVKGSTELIAELDAEQADRLLKPVLDCMMDSVHRYEGTVTRVTGDGIMALFGAPLSHEDHALRACYAALKMQEAMHLEMEALRREHGTPIQIRVGLNSGEVVVRSIGNDLYMEYTAMGQTVHLAARMEQLATPGTSLLTNETLRLVEGLVQVKPLGPVRVKGLADRQEVAELVGVSRAQSRLRTSAGGRLTPFIGRRSETASLAAAREAAGDGHGQVVGVVGEPGLGKTRLFYEFTRTPAFDGWLVLESDAVSYGRTSVYHPAIELLRGYFDIDEHDGPRMIREKVSGRLVTLDQRLMSTLPAVLSLFDVPVDDQRWLTLDAPARREQTLDAVTRLFVTETRIRPVCLVIENLHSIDSETHILIDRLVEGLLGARLLLLVNYRPDFRHEWGGKRLYTQLRLDPLPIDGASELLERLLGTDAALQSLKTMLIERTEGNPFFLEESVRALAEAGALSGAPGSYRAAVTIDTLKVPATIQALLSSRVDRLAPRDKNLLQCAAVVGKDVPHGLLEAVSDLGDGELHAALVNLQSAGFLYEASLFPELEYGFNHALTHEVVYDSLLTEQCRSLHGRIADAIERLYHDRSGEHVERLAYHAFQGELWNRSIGYLRRASGKAAARSAYPEAAAGFERALVALRHIDESRETLEQAIDIRFELRGALQAIGEHDRLYEHLHQAESIASTLDDRSRLGWASAYLSQYLWRRGDPRRAARLGERARAIAGDLEDFGLEVVASFFLGQGSFNVGGYLGAVDHCTRIVAALDAGRAHERFGLTGLPAVLARIWLAWSLAERGKFDEGLAHAQQSLSFAIESEQPYSMAASNLAVGQIELVRGRLDEAIPVLEHAAELCATWNLRVIAQTTIQTLGLAYAERGRVEEGLSLAESEAYSTFAHRIFDTPTASAALGTTYLLAGRLDEALEAGSRAARLSAERGFLGNRARIMLLLGEIDARRVPPNYDQAKDCYSQSLTLANELGMPPLAARCALGLGTLYRRIGDDDRAQRELTRAAELADELGMQLSEDVAPR